MKFTTGMIAVAAWLLGPLPAPAGDILFDADQYGEVVLRLPQSALQGHGPSESRNRSRMSDGRRAPAGAEHGPNNSRGS